jgi:hypothetical protein
MIAALNRWIGDAREGWFRVGGLTVATTRRVRRAERNGFELGRDYERGQQSPMSV